jgi:lactate dehydrogenase-like 2-hydroxyacid dehydrogenase
MASIDELMKRMLAKGWRPGGPAPEESVARARSRATVDIHEADKPLPRAELLARLKGRQGLISQIVDTVDDEVLATPGLRVVSNIAVGYNNIDVGACTVRGIMVTNTPGVLTESTADFAWALLLAAARRITEAESYLRQGEWTRWQLKQLLGVDVHGARLGIIGMGRIGQAVARRAHGFDMIVRYHNRNRLPSEMEQALGVAYEEKEALLEQADFVVLTVPYSWETHHLIGRAELWKMKSNAILVNIARGGVVDDEALVEALQARRILAAGLDVYENEPKLHPGFLKLKNVVLSPHIASSTHGTRLAMAMTAARNLVAALSGAVPENLVNPEVRWEG